MKPLGIIALMFIVAVLPGQADILVNGTFADGRAHWKGDAENLDSSNDPANPSAPGGVTITLKKDKWTKIYQTFSTHEKKVQYTLTFSLSPDYHVEQNSSDESSSISPSAGLDDIEGMYPLYLAGTESWTLIVEEVGDGGSSYHYIGPDLKKTGSQTLTGKIGGLKEHADKILLLAFPPGEGTITLTSIALTPEDE